MDKLKQLREKIDVIDDGIADLFNERMRVVKEIGEEKAKSGSNVTDYLREKSVINRVCKRVDEDKIVFAKQTFEGLFDTSKGYQSQFANVQSELAFKIINAIESTGECFPTSAIVACQGVAGTHSMLACERLFKVSDVVYFKDLNGVFSAVDNGLCEYGIVPIEESDLGSNSTVYDLLRKYNFYASKSVSLKIKYSLLAKKGTSLEDIKTVYADLKAIERCKNFLNQMIGVEVKLCEDSALGGKLVSKSEDKTVGCIASPECTSVYGLTSVKNNVQNSDGLYTKFLCVSKTLENYPNSNKVSLSFVLPHYAGMIAKVLTKFSSLSLNVTKIEAKPLSYSELEYLVYLDFEGDVRRKEVLNLLSELSNSTEKFCFLGCYGEV